MANLRVFEHRAPLGGTVVPILPGQPIAKQQVAIGANTQSAAFGTETTMLHVQAEGICSVEIGASPTAVAGQSYRLAAGSEQTFSVAPGHKIAVIADT